MIFQPWKRIVMAVTLLVFTVPTTGSADLLPNNRHVFINVANDAGVKYNMDGAAYGGPNNTYYIKADGGGNNAMHITTNPSMLTGQNTVISTPLPNPSGTFYFSDTGGRGFTDNMILMVSIKGSVGNNFRVNIASSGYTWPPALAGVYNPPFPTYSYTSSAMNEEFSAADLIYGPHLFKPGPGGDGTTPSWTWPYYYGQNTSDPTNAEYFMFVDLRAGTLYSNSPYVSGVTLIDNGLVKIDYSFTNLYANASFNIYGWASASNQGEGISWINDTTSLTGSSSYTINYTGPYGSYTIADALKALHVTVGLETATPEETAHFDVAPLVNGSPQASGIVDILDVLMILRRVVGLPTW